MSLALLSLLALFLQEPSAKPELSRCYSLYNPVAMGSEWEYRGEMHSTGNDGKETIGRYENRQRVVALSANSMHMLFASRFMASDGVRPTSRTDDYVCGDEGVVQAGGMSEGTRVTYHGSESPLRSEPGTKWQTVMEYIDGEGTGFRYITRFEVVGTEPIVVPAGRFDALKVSWQQEIVRVDPNAKRLAQYLRSSEDMQMSMKGFRWYAPQVGQVRSSFETITSFKGKQQSRSEGVEELVAFRP